MRYAVVPRQMQVNFMPFPGSQRTASTDHCSLWALKPGGWRKRHWGSWRHGTIRRWASLADCCDVSSAAFLSDHRMLRTGLFSGQKKSRVDTHAKRWISWKPLSNMWPTRLVYSAKRMSGVVFASFKAIFTEVKVIAVPALEPGTIDREHLASVTPKNKTSTATLHDQNTEMCLQSPCWYCCIQIENRWAQLQNDCIQNVERATYLTPGWILGTSSISDNRPVQWDCWGKSTITSFPLALKA